MSNLEKYNNVFTEFFEISLDVLETLEYQSIESWDSIGHMGLMSELEEIFDIALETDDIIDFSSYNKGKEILLKYGVNI